MSKDLIAYIADQTPNGLRDFGVIEDEMILSNPYYGYNYDESRNDEQLSKIFDRVIGLKGRLPDLDTLSGEVWDHNGELLHEMAIGYTLDEYHQAGIDIENEINEEALQQDIDNWHVSCEQMYAESGMLDEMSEIHRYATKNGISYMINKDTDSFDIALCSFDMDTEKDIVMNPAQGVMFDEFINDEETLFNYGGFAVHYMARG